MKKVVLLVTLFAIVFLTGSCDKEYEKVNAIAEIEVKVDGEVRSGITVYMFTEQTGPNTSFFVPFHARKFAVTDSKGIARFELIDALDLSPVTTQNTFYYGVFGESNDVLGTVSITIKKGETKKGSIKI